MVVILTAIVARYAHRAARNLFGKLYSKASLRDLFAQFVYIGVWFVGIMLAAGIVFPDFGFGQIVATAGLASIAIGFAFQDIFENFFAGILILWRFPFEIGDYIDIEGTDIEGQVEDIWIRMTHLRKTTGELLLVPNATIYKHPVRVLTDQKKRRTTIIAGVAYSEDVDESRAVIRKAVESCDTVKKDEPIQVFAQEFADSSINFEVTWWTGPTPLDLRKSTDQVVAAVKRGLDEAGIEIPFPYRTLTFRGDSPLRLQNPSENDA
ncbi:mechanosensitive ion channel family protein [Planctomycetales bacterium ZRK34]|nr:mechanosensitive ion channel family protein [Planctomycetales bacterium ZRK34]